MLKRGTTACMYIVHWTWPLCSAIKNL